MASKTASSDKKKEEVFVGNVKIVHRDSSKELEEFVVRSASNALQSFYKGESGHYTDIAKQIKKDMEETEKGTWHVVVGRAFGSYVSHEVKQYVDTTLDILEKK